MKSLPELNATYQGRNIEALVDFARVAPIQLPEEGKYFVELRGREVHIYGQREISAYRVLNSSAVNISSVNTNAGGAVIEISGGSIDMLFIHTTPYTGRTKLKSGASNSGESQSSSSESRGARSSESRPAPQYESPSRSSGESRRGGESH